MYFEMRSQEDKVRNSGKDSQDLETVDLESLNSVFSLRKPRDIRAGLSSGSKSVVKGILAGTVSLVGAPVVGAVSSGWVGFAKGVGIGKSQQTSDVRASSGTCRA